MLAKASNRWVLKWNKAPKGNGRHLVTQKGNRNLENSRSNLSKTFGASLKTSQVKLNLKGERSHSLVIKNFKKGNQGKRFSINLNLRDSKESS
jgi:hypothetical protein